MRHIKHNDIRMEKKNIVVSMWKITTKDLRSSTVILPTHFRTSSSSVGGGRRNAFQIFIYKLPDPPGQPSKNQFHEFIAISLHIVLYNPKHRIETHNPFFLCWIVSLNMPNAQCFKLQFNLNRDKNGKHIEPPYPQT